MENKSGWVIYEIDAKAYAATPDHSYVDSFEAAYKWPTKEAARAKLGNKEMLRHFVISDVPVTPEIIAKAIPYNAKAKCLRKRLIKLRDQIKLEREDLNMNDGPPEMLVDLDEAADSLTAAFEKTPRTVY